jgi:uncharacterized membrane protein
MPLSILLIMSIGLVVGAALQCLAPLNFRPGIFFGITVDPEFRRTEDAQRILWSYRRPIIVMTVLCVGILWLVVPRLGGPAAPIAASALVFLGVSVAIISMARATRHVRAFAKPLSPIRTVSVISRKRALPGGWLPLFGPMLIVGTARWLLLMKRESMPAEVYGAALALLLVPFVSNAFFMWVAWLATFRMRRINAGGPAANEESADRRSGYWLRLGLAYFQTFLWVAMALAVARITTAATGPRFVLIAWASLVILAIIALVHVVKRRRLALDTPGVAITDNTPDSCWKWGIIYYNPEDPALVVETRTGRSGCDLNFGNKWSWLVTAVILATPFVIRLLWF